MAVVQPQQFSIDGGNRLVWVLNRDPERDYHEKYKDEDVMIPKNLRRIPKLLKDGGNLMPWLAARKFLGQPVTPSSKTPQGEIINMGKPLCTSELTDEERMELSGTNVVQLKKIKDAELQAEKKSHNTCTLCTDDVKSFASKKGLELHLKKIHPEKTPLESL